jgi:hypothetical protein
MPHPTEYTCFNEKGAHASQIAYWPGQVTFVVVNKIRVAKCPDPRCAGDLVVTEESA